MFQKKSYDEDNDSESDNKSEVRNKIDFSEKKEYSFEREEYEKELDPIGVAVSNQIFDNNAELLQLHSMANIECDEENGEGFTNDPIHDEEYDDDDDDDNQDDIEIGTAEQHGKFTYYYFVYRYQ